MHSRITASPSSFTTYIVSKWLLLRIWHRLASDNAIWYSLFARRHELGWAVDLRRVDLAKLPSTALFAYSHIYAQPRSPLSVAPLELDWYELYKTRAELDRRWSGNPHAVNGPEDKENARAWEPRIRRLLGHADRFASFAEHSCIHYLR